MDNLKAVYRILSALEKSMDCPGADMEELIGSGALGVSSERWARYIEMLADAGYIKGARVRKSVTGDTLVDVSSARITLSGIEYLQENSVMQRIYRAAKGGLRT